MAKILVVDESEQRRRLIRGSLEGGQHQLLEAGGEREALALARGGRPDLIIVDIIMPTMDGSEFVRLLAADLGYPKARVVLSAAQHLAREARVLSEACGIRNVAVTPWEPAVFRKLIDSTLAGIEEPNPVAEAHPTTNADAGSDAISRKLIALMELNEGNVAGQDAGQIVAETCRRARYV
ncbi:MAG: response regulator, partial [Blastocatellia bacterium]